MYFLYELLTLGSKCEHCFHSKLYMYEVYKTLLILVRQNQLGNGLSVFTVFEDMTSNKLFTFEPRIAFDVV